jgi:hypothetical protein
MIAPSAVGCKRLLASTRHFRFGMAHSSGRTLGSTRTFESSRCASRSNYGCSRLLGSQLRDGPAWRKRVLHRICTSATQNATIFDRQHSVGQAGLATKSAGNGSLTEDGVDASRLLISGGGLRHFVHVPVLQNDIYAHIDTLVTNENSRASDEFAHIGLSFAAERAP